MSDSGSHDELVAQWLAVNPGSEEQARFYLEANNWDLNAALSNFYEEPPLSEGLPSAAYQEDPALPLDPTSEAGGPSEVRGPTAAPIEPPVTTVGDGPSPGTGASSSVPRRRYGSGARIATLSSIRQQSNDNEENEQEWYAGGERSGTAIRPPPKDGDNDGPMSLVDQIMRRATEDSSSAAMGTSQNITQPKFSGSGRKLESNDNEASDDDYVPSDDESDGDYRNSRSRSYDDSSAEDESVAVRELTFWRNGFSIGDGPLYNTEDPRNRQILEAFLQGRAPLDILNVRSGQQVEMKITRRTDEDYVPPPKPPAQAFSGQGRRLGGIPSPSLGQPSTSSSIPGGFPQKSSESSSETTASANPITLDGSQPTVQIQIRLADGTRLVAKVNPSHTIDNLRQFVLSQRPGAESRPFVFKTMLPSKTLDKDDMTVKEAGIANAAIVQHYI